MFISIETANKNGIRKFPGSPVVIKTSNGEGAGLIPGWEATCLAAEKPNGPHQKKKNFRNNKIKIKLS